MSLTHVNSEKLVKPYGYSHAVVASPGQVVFIAGQVASDLSGRVDAEMGYTEQAATALQNFIHALEATGASLENLAQMTIYVVGLNAETGEEMFKGIAATSKAAGMKPSASVITGVSSLMDPAALVEISGIAVIPE